MSPFKIIKTENYTYVLYKRGDSFVVVYYYDLMCILIKRALIINKSPANAYIFISY